jgi:hypothetical protein
MDTGICDSSAPPSVTIVVRPLDKTNPTKTKEPKGSLNIKKNWDLTPINSSHFTHAPMRTPWPLAGHAAGPWTSAWSPPNQDRPARLRAGLGLLQRLARHGPMRSLALRACPAARWPSRRHQCGSTQQLQKPLGTGRCRHCRPTQLDGQITLLDFNVNAVDGDSGCGYRLSDGQLNEGWHRLVGRLRQAGKDGHCRQGSARPHLRQCNCIDVGKANALPWLYKTFHTGDHHARHP